MNIAEQVDRIVRDSLWTDEEMKDMPQEQVKDKSVCVEGITTNIWFHPQRIESHRAEVVELLKVLGPNFHKDGGGGYTFLSMPFTEDGAQWGEQRDAELLLLLALGLKIAAYCLPRPYWNMLPGEMPYIRFTY